MLKNKRLFSGMLSGFLLCGVLNITPVFCTEHSIGTSRLLGSDRYSIAVAVSNAGWTQAATVIIATGLDYP